MTTSDSTGALHHTELRQLIDQASALPLADRLTLLKGLVPGVAAELTPTEFGALIGELGLKGERFYEALEHPGEGRSSRQVMGERDLEGR